jgi:NIMA (never in mitosis gene a)-related kinase
MNVSKVTNSKGLNYTQTGTPYYASPEVWKDEPYDIKSDVWSLGCVIFEMVTLRPPFQAEDMQGLYKKILKGQLPNIPEHFSHDMHAMLSLMIQVNPTKRPTCDELIENPIFKRRS